MRKTTILSLFMIICALIYTGPCLSFTKEIDHKLETTVQKTIDEYNIPGAVVGVWIPGKGEWAEAFGFANRETKEKMKIDDRFKVRGLSYTLVMIGFFKLLDEGKVSLDDKLSKYIKNIPNGDKITLGYLLSQKNDLLPSVKGFPRSNPATTVEEFKKRLSETHTFQEFLDTGLGPHVKGENYVDRFILLSLVIEKVSGMSLEKYFEKNIFEPLKLQHTSMSIDGAKLPPSFAHGYAKIEFNNAVSEMDLSFANPYMPLDAAVSNLPDLKILAEAIGTGSLIKKESFQHTKEWKEGPSNPKVGLGMIMLDNGWLMPTVEEFVGYDAVVAYLPEKKAVLVCLTNTFTRLEKNGLAISPARFLSREIAAILGLPLMADGGIPVKKFMENETGKFKAVLEKGKSQSK